MAISTFSVALKSLLGICAVAFFIIFFFHAEKKRIEALDIKRSDFPNNFHFGTATSAQQIEGAGNEAGRGPSVWDTYASVPGNIKDGSNSLIAIDSYRRYKEDIQLLKQTGVDSYRFSISWSRILPMGSLAGGINQEGIDFYNDVINELLANGIKPFVTMLHFDTPQALETAYGGFLNRSIVDDFKDYSELLFKTYGDRVKYWMTINEPFVVALGYDLGKMAPGRCSVQQPNGSCPSGNSSTEPYIIGHHLLLAHATSAKLYKEKFQAKQGGKIGIVVVGEFMEPLTNTTDDIAAAERYLDFLFGWHIEPLVFGDYPKTMRQIVKERLPTLSEEEKRLVVGSFDFIGVNYYTSRYVTNAQQDVPPHYLGDFMAKTRPARDGILIGPKCEGNGYVYSYPQGLQKLLEFMKNKYNNPAIYITENGFPEANVVNRPLAEALNDQSKIKFIKDHLYYTNQALKNGVKVKGYFYWSLFDNFEWSNGYMVRYGLYFIDYKNNLNRIPKASAKWLPAFLKGEDKPSQK